MKIGTLTLPLHHNYGGILQAWALSTYLQTMGHEVEIINRKKSTPFIKTIASPFAEVKKIFRLIIFRLSSGRVVVESLLTRDERHLIYGHTDEFITKHFSISPSIKSTKSLKKYVKKSNFDAIIVGSDQCWRPNYVPNVYDYFLGFDTKSKFKRIAYSPSFGVDEWLYTPEETKKCKDLLAKFDAVSVREKSAVELCKNYFEKDVAHLIDPTMLITREQYEHLSSDCVKPISGELFCYILDNNAQINKSIAVVAEKYKCMPFYCMPQLSPCVSNIKHHPEDCVFPSVEQWLQSFSKAKMVLCDSFHGCVFSIIFNKPFWVVGNKKRGMTRFKSLLSTFKLESRLVDIKDLSSIDLYRPIDWDEVNTILNEEKKKSNAFLKNSII